jgi:acyl-coenzyme A synthetase/AMP-(fatty) acid ligase
LLTTHPKIADAAVVGQLDSEWGHIVVAHVVPSDPANPPSLDEVREFVKLQLPVWYAPKALRLHTALPKTALGKVRRADLRD